MIDATALSTIRPSAGTAAAVGRRRALLLAFALGWCGLASPALASSFDAQTGKITLTGLVSYGFEPSSSLPAGVTLQAGDRQGNPVDDSVLEAAFLADGGAIEGQAGLAVGKGVVRLVAQLDAASPLAGRRVALTLWYQPRGMAPSVRLRWMVGSQTLAGDLVLLPTGRATDDGWIELASGPFDFLLGGALAPALRIVDPRAERTSLGTELDPEGYCLVDALDIEDLGPAAVAPAACTLPTEATACGEVGACHFGRCVDAAAVFGPLPALEIRNQYLDRLAFEMQEICGNRAADAGMAEYLARLAQMRAATTARDFWPVLVPATELLRDAHASAPMVSYVSGWGLGTCLHLGAPDLLPDAASLGRTPLVFSVDAGSPLFGQIEPGDALVAIDGLPVASWMALAARHFSYNGDPDAREVVVAPQILSAAVRTGSRLTFARCANLVGPCADGETVTVEVDLAALTAPLWLGQEPQLGIEVGCDYRFQRLATGRIGGYMTFAWADDGPVRIVEFNGLPSESYSGTQAWFAELRAAMDPAVTRLVLDERTGYGGSDGDLVFSVPLCDEQCVTGYLFPRFDGPVDQALIDQFLLCGTFGGGGLGCGFAMPWGPVPYSNGELGTMSATRVALLTSMDVSENDFLTRFITSRGTGEVQVLGPGPTMGGFGSSLPLSIYYDEYHGGGCQMSDTVWGVGGGQLVSSQWASGVGVAPDQVVLQKQSDILRGVDTLLEAAKAWLLQ